VKVTAVDPRSVSIEKLLTGMTHYLPVASYPPTPPKELPPPEPAMASFRLGTRFWVGICLAAAGGGTLLYLNRR
jgi:hypothetical protein